MKDKDRMSESYSGEVRGGRKLRRTVSRKVSS